MPADDGRPTTVSGDERSCLLGLLEDEGFLEGDAPEDGDDVGDYALDVGILGEE